MRAEDLMNLGRRIERQRTATDDQDETVLLKPGEVDLVVQALLGMGTLKASLTILGICP